MSAALANNMNLNIILCEQLDQLLAILQLAEQDRLPANRADHRLHDSGCMLHCGIAQRFALSACLTPFTGRSNYAVKVEILEFHGASFC